jgi:hypothetical protein
MRVRRRNWARDRETVWARSDNAVESEERVLTFSVLTFTL